MMAIHSAANTYTVFARLRGDRHRLIARDADGNVRLLILTDNPTHTRCLASVLLDLKDSRVFTDFVESFTHKGCLCAVFSYPDIPRAQPLRNTLSGAPYALRAAALRSLFARLLAQEVPCPVLCDILRPENLFCSPSGDVDFVYDLYPTTDYIFCDWSKTLLLMEKAVREICGGASSPPLDALYAKLRSPARPDWSELFAAASDAAEALALCRPAPSPPKLSLRKRFSQARDRLSEFLAAFMAVVLLFIAYIVLCILFYNTVISPAPADNGLKSIGTVVLENDNSGPESGIQAP